MEAALLATHSQRTRYHPETCLNKRCGCLSIDARSVKLILRSKTAGTPMTHDIQQYFKKIQFIKIKIIIDFYINL